MTGKALMAGLFAISVFSAPAIALADIYQWEDASGVMHFTDDVKKVPARYRDKMRVQKSAAPTSDAAAPESNAKGAEKTGSDDELYGDYTLHWWLETFRKKKIEVSQASTLIGTKREFIQALERGRRFGQIYEQADVDKYNAYKAELPADEQRLKDLDEEVAELKRKAAILGVPREIIEQ